MLRCEKRAESLFYHESTCTVIHHGERTNVGKSSGKDACSRRPLIGSTVTLGWEGQVMGSTVCMGKFVVFSGPES